MKTLTCWLLLTCSVFAAQPFLSEHGADIARQYFPKRFDDPKLLEIVNDPDTIFYTDQEMPRAYQFQGGVHSAYYNISANGGEPYGNGNREAPWGTPFGLQYTPGVGTIKFISLPKQDNGRPWPIVWFQASGQLHWRFPVGTVVGELLHLPDLEGRRHTFEIRTKTRYREAWAPDVFRPFPTPQSLADRIKELRPNWEDNKTLSAAIERLEGQSIVQPVSFSDRQPQRAVFRQVAGDDILPPLGDPKLVDQLLGSTEFHSVAGLPWRSGGKLGSHAPDTHMAYGIVPANYRANLVQVDSHHCMQCHETAGMDVNNFNAGRDWYGSVRGSDGIFSFHPFDPSCVSGNGFRQQPVFRNSLIQNGVLAQYNSRDKQRFPDSIYTSVPGLSQ